MQSEVISLLRLQGWKVSTEKIVGHKKVDALGSKSDDFGLPQTIAIEVKSGKSGCAREEVSKIYADYLPLVQSRHVDFILLVTEADLTPAAVTYITETSDIRHLTYFDLLNRVIDFSHYLDGLEAQFEESHLATRYVPQHYGEGEDLLEDLIISWSESDQSQPIAILGGYGIGKSTLARRIASYMAVQYKNNPKMRIPVLVPLSYLATDQTLEGLLGRLFTTNTNVHNYNYDLFRALNRRGKFLILLDGFDEMKRTMSWDSLRYNLSQLNLLIDRKSKVVLLGRPTAFVTEEEHNEALHGRRRINRQDRRLPDWPDYMEVNIQPFTRMQVKQYLLKVIQSIENEENRENKAKVSHKFRRYFDRIEGPEGRRLIELVSRPVQLKMLAEILPDYDGDFSNMTVAMLYEEFIDLVIRRELDKDSRRSFGVKDRRRFAGKLAFLLWQNDQKNEIDASKIPDEFFEEFSKSADDDLSAIRRDLLSGCFLEKKPPNSFFFPHRSFQEYLVADRLAEVVKTGNGDLVDCPYLTNEILSFFVELMGRHGISAWRKKVERNEHHLNNHALELMQASCVYYNFPIKVDSTGKVVTSKEISKEERERLTKRLLIGDIVSRKSHEEKAKRPKKRQRRSPHKQEGVTRKKMYNR